MPQCSALAEKYKIKAEGMSRARSPGGAEQGSPSPNTARILLLSAPPLEWNKKPFWAQQSRARTMQIRAPLRGWLICKDRPGCRNHHRASPSPGCPQLPPVFIFHPRLCNDAPHIKAPFPILCQHRWTGCSSSGARGDPALNIPPMKAKMGFKSVNAQCTSISPVKRAVFGTRCKELHFWNKCLGFVCFFFFFS